MIKLPADEMQAIAQRAKNLRLQQRLTQGGLAKRSGVSLGSLKRFENTGRISLESLLKIAFVLNASQDFDSLFTIRNTGKLSLDALLKNQQTPKRGVKS